ncbi:hypothetical protein D3C78_1973550 [compost metagenome]
MPQGLAGQGDARTEREQGDAEQGHPRAAEAVDQRPGDEGREKHAEHVPLDHPRAVLQR